MEIALKAKHRRRKPTQAGYTISAGSGNSGNKSAKHVKINHNTCLARVKSVPGATLGSVGCPHHYRPEEHGIRYDALRGTRVCG